jgi:hypothetical protein
VPVDPDAEALFATKAEVAALSAKLDTLTSNVTASVSELKAADTQLKGADNALDGRIDALEAAKPPVTPPVEPPVEPPPTGWTPKFPGDTKTGEMRWGSAYGSNSEPGTRYGTPGRGIARTYWGNTTSSWNSSVTRAKSDIAKGVLPWVSYKTTGWAAFANGGSDTDFKKLLTDLDAIGKPVWLTVHHEPEGSAAFGTDEGTPTDNSSINNWKNMQRHVRDLMKAVGTKNIAFAPVLMAWTWEPASNRVAKSWIDGMDGVWDFFGIDCYNDTTKGTTFQSMNMYKLSTADLKARGYRIGYGEWGIRDNAIAACQDEFLRQGFVGVAYFDCDLNSPSGGWSLTAAQLPLFNAECAGTPRV